MKFSSLLIGSFILVLSMASSAVAKTFFCPSINIKQYGKTVYFDPRTGRSWNLTWSLKETPIWETAFIPQSTVCGKGKSENGIPVSYQCAVFQCQSRAVKATLGQNHAMKCFSAYVSTQNVFYCDGFTTG